MLVCLGFFCSAIRKGSFDSLSHRFTLVAVHRRDLLLLLHDRNISVLRPSQQFRGSSLQDLQPSKIPVGFELCLKQICHLPKIQVSFNRTPQNHEEQRARKPTVPKRPKEPARRELEDALVGRLLHLDVVHLGFIQCQGPKFDETAERGKQRWVH